MAHLSLALLGTPKVLRDGEPISGFRSQRSLALLAFLAIEADRVHQRNVLAALLWPESPDRTALNNLRTALASLRKAIGDAEADPPFLLISRDSFRLNPVADVTVDAVEFQRLVARAELARKVKPPSSGLSVAGNLIDELEVAVALYRGCFLEGFSIPSLEFQDWALLWQERLHERMLAALRWLADLSEEQGERERAIHHVRRLLALEPLDEEGHRYLMRLLARCGQRNQALAHYEHYCQLLGQELGVEPELETTTLYNRIRQVRAASAHGAPLPPSASATGRDEDESPERGAPLCVARERELRRLAHHLGQALDGEGRVVFVKGDSGSGKTTLIHAFAQRAMSSHADLVVASGRCNAYSGIGDPYLPFAEILEMLSGDARTRQAGGAITREHARRLEIVAPTMLQALLETGPALLEVMVSSASLLTEGTAALSDAPNWQARIEEALRRRGTGAVPEGLQQADLFAQCTRVLQALSRVHPLMLVLDDLQWADAGSLGLLFHLGRRVPGSRILIVGAYRTEEVALGRDGEPHPLVPLVNEFQQVWGDVCVDLAEADGHGLVEELVDSEPNRLDAVFRQALFQHTGGQALFTVELLRGLQARGVLQRDEARRWVQTATLDWATLPARVESVIAQQIGRLPTAWRELLAAASVEGEEFTAEVAAHVRGLDEGDALHVLNGVLSSRYRLVDAHAMRRIGPQRLSRYRFRHHLFQHYLYQRLNPVERARLHEEVGDALEGLYGTVPEFIFETWPIVEDRLAALYGPRAMDVAAILPQLAWHYRAAGLADKAAAYLSQAAYSAIRSFAFTEAAGHASQGVALIQSLPFTLERARQEMAFQSTVSIAYRLVRGSSYPAVDRAIVRLCELARQTGDDVRLIWGLYGRSHSHWNRAEYHAAIEVAEEMLALVQCTAPGLLPDVHFYLGGALWASIGRLAVARRYLDPLFGPGSTQGTLRPWPGRVAPMSGVPPIVYWCAGYPDLALTLAEEAMDLTPSGYSVFFRNGYLLARRLRREAHAVLQGALTMLPETSEEGVSSQRGAALYWLGWAHAQLGLPEQGIAEMRQALGIWQQRGTRVNQTFWLAGLAEGYTLAGQPQTGLHVIAEAFEHVELTDERWYEAELHRLQGELLQQCSDDPEQIEACFRQAIAVAQQQEAKSWELRATTSLCRLLHSQDRREEARQTLSAILGWFTEGFGTPDLQEATALLSALAA